MPEPPFLDAGVPKDNAPHLWHPMARPGAMKKSAPEIIARGEGCWIWDVDGHKMLDGVGGLWCSNLGHNRRGAMVRISGPNLILSPPLVITREEVDQLVDVLEASFSAVQSTL